jgi:CRP-like cAMP-binding protein
MVVLSGAQPGPVILTRPVVRLSPWGVANTRIEEFETALRRFSMTINVNLLRGLSLFTNLSESQLEKVAGICRQMTVYPGQILFKEREPGDTIFLSLKDDLEVLFSVGSDSMARMEWLGADETLGTIALIPPHQYVSTARGLTEGTLLAIDVAKMQKLFQQDGRIAVSMIPRITSASHRKTANMKSEL